MQRPVATASGPGTAAFTVVRVEPGEMAEGRMQILTHRTEHTVWQPRWLSHPNGALGLLDLVIAVADVDEAAERFQRFTARPATANSFGRAIQLDRGRVQLVSASVWHEITELRVPALPFAAGYAVAVRSLEIAEERLRAANMTVLRHGRATLTNFPEELGIGVWIFTEKTDDLPWRRPA
jgi:hypothetical protein